MKSFKINLILELFMCCRLELLELFLNFYSLGVKCIFFKILTSNFGELFYCLHFPLNFHNFPIFSPIRIAKLRKFKTRKTCWLGWGGEGVYPTI